MESSSVYTADVPMRGTRRQHAARRERPLHFMLTQLTRPPHCCLSGMGKSTVSSMFRDEGVPIFDADAIVHDVYKPGGAAVAPLLERFPAARAEDGGVSRPLLSKEVVGNEVAVSHNLSCWCNCGCLCFSIDIELTEMSSKGFGQDVSVVQAAMKYLEAIVHPLVVSERGNFFATLPEGSQLVLFDIPLLYETGGEDQVLRYAVFDSP